jgi:hypothetical protein
MVVHVVFMVRESHTAIDDISSAAGFLKNRLLPADVRVMDLYYPDKLAGLTKAGEALYRCFR